MKVRSMVGLIPLFAVETLEPELLDTLPDFKRRLEWFIDHRKDLVTGCRERGISPPVACKEAVKVSGLEGRTTDSLRLQSEPAYS